MVEKSKSTQPNAQAPKKDKAEKEIDPVEIKEKEKSQVPPTAIQKKKVVKKDDIPIESAKPMNLGFGPLGALGGGPSTDESTSTASNFF